MKINKKFDLKSLKLKNIKDEDNLEKYITIPEDEEYVLSICQEYAEVDYPINLRKVITDKESYWIAEHPDLKGCITHGETKQEALMNLDDAKQGWVYAKLCDGEEIPKPLSSETSKEYSGKILIRIPRELHSDLITQAQLNGISLNQQILFLLSQHSTESKLRKMLEEIFFEMHEFSDCLKENNRLIGDQYNIAKSSYYLFDDLTLDVGNRQYPKRNKERLTYASVENYRGGYYHAKQII